MIVNSCLIVSLIGNIIFIILLLNKPDRNLELMQLMELRMIKAENENNKLKIVNRYLKSKLKDMPEYNESEPPPAPPGRELDKPKTFMGYPLVIDPTMKQDEIIMKNENGKTIYKVKEMPKAPPTEPKKGMI